MKKLLTCMLLVLALTALCAAGLAAPRAGARAAADRDALAPATNFTLWGYTDRYLISWFNELHNADNSNNENWKEQFRLFVRTGNGAEWQDVTDQSICLWSHGGEIYTPATFSNGATVEVGIAARDAQGNLGEYVTTSFKYYTADCGPIKNLRAKMEDGKLKLAFDRYTGCANTKLQLSNYVMDLSWLDMPLNEIGEYDCFLGQGLGLNPKYNGWDSDFVNPDDLDGFRIHISCTMDNTANPASGRYYYPDGAYVEAEMRKGSDGKFHMYQNGELVDTTGADFDPDPVMGWDGKGLSYRLSGKNAYVVNNPAYLYYQTLDIPASFTYEGRTYKVVGIDDDAFKDVANLTGISIGKNVKTIGKNAFRGCTALKSVTGMAGVTKIGDSAFQNCKVLPKITLPAKVKTIGKNAFNGCKKLKTITIKTTKLTTKTVGANAFKGVYKKATVKVPAKKLKAYKSLLVKKGLPKTAKVKK